MPATTQEHDQVFKETERIGTVLYRAKEILRQAYIMRKEFIRMNPNVHENVDHPSLVPMDLSVRVIATPENIEEHLKQLHTALRHCLGLFICFMETDEVVRGPKRDLLGNAARIVRVQLEQLLDDTKDMMTGNGPHLETSAFKHAQCSPEEHTAEKNFGHLVFTYTLLDDLPLWLQLFIRNMFVFRDKKEKEEMEKLKQ